MKTQHFTAKLETKDSKEKSERRFRNILANSGEIMESGEIRELDDLYVMGYDSELIKISDLNTDPNKQTEKYAVKAQADHGEVVDGEIVPSIEKQFGSCKVWLESDGLHARMYFADDDRLADHAWAISEDASYSTGIDWYPDGYYGTGYEITHPIGILREISMVLTGNDPRAKTIDTKKQDDEAKSKVHRDAEAGASANGDNNTNSNDGDKEMSKETQDNLTPDEAKALKAELGEVLDKFTTKAPEDETEPTARESKDAEGEAEASEGEKEATTDAMPRNVIVVNKTDSVKQEKGSVKKADWLRTSDAKNAFASALKSAGRMNAAFDGLWRNEVSKHMSLDGITGLPLPVDVVSMFRDALENSDGIISHFEFISTKGLHLNLISAVNDEGGRAKGFNKGDTKQNQQLQDTVRDVLTKMVYKRLDLDAMEVYENPNIIEFRSRELVNAIIVEIERAAFIGDGRSAPSGSNPDLRMFVNNRGFFSIKADAAAAATSYGGLVASSVNAGTNAYESVVAARGQIKTEGRQFIVAKAEWVTAAMTAKVGSDYLVQPGVRIEDVLGVERVYTPSWMDTDTVNDAYLVVDGAYKMIGESQIRVRPDFDTSTNQDILLDETPRGGSLGEYKSAVAIKKAAASS